MIRRIKASLGIGPGWRRRKAGDAARNDKNWLIASQAYGDYLVLNPDDGAIWVQCGHARKEAGDLSGAEDAYRRAVDSDPNDPDALFQLGAFMLRLDEPGEAIGLLRRSAALGFEAAIRDLASLGVGCTTAEAVERAPSLSDVALLRTLLDAQAARDLNQQDEAVRLYNAYLDSVPGSAQALAELDMMRSQIAQEKGHAHLR